jgi:hypothetical protein
VPRGTRCLVGRSGAEPVAPASTARESA